MSSPTPDAASPLLSHEEVVTAILARPHTGSLRLIAVDGRAGSGKSTFAAQLARAVEDAPVVPLDDFLSWDDLTEFWARLERDLLAPLLAGQTVTYQARDWERDPYGRALGPWRTIAPAPAVILEGVGAGRQSVRARLSFLVWIETPRATCLERGLKRDGEANRERWLDWQRREDAFFYADPVRGHADAIVDGRRSVRS